MLPEDCLSTIVSLTSPIDACRCALVSSWFGAASESDHVWASFLPSDHQDLISRSINFDTNNNKSQSSKLCSKKELFFRLCTNPILIDGGKKCFQIGRASGKKSYMVCARELKITWSDEPMYWTWKPMPQSRFAEVVELRTISWLEIHGRIKTKTLSKNTTYCAYLVMNISNRAYGLATRPFETSIHVGNQQEPCRGTVVVYGPTDHENKRQREASECKPKVAIGNEHKTVSSKRSDGWLEIELGEFFVGEDDDEEVKMTLSETKGYHLKAGLVIEGIEVRPKDY